MASVGIVSFILTVLSVIKNNKRMSALQAALSAGGILILSIIIVLIFSNRVEAIPQYGIATKSLVDVFKSFVIDDIRSEVVPTILAFAGLFIFKYGWNRAHYYLR